MVVVLTGVQASGKTSVADSLRQCRYFDNYLFLDSKIEDLKISSSRIPFGINEQGNTYTQLLLINKQLQNLRFEDAVLDRCLLDTLVYTHHLYTQDIIPKWVLDYSKETFQEYRKYYDYIFLFKSNKHMLVENGVRSFNKEYQNRIQTIFELYIKALNIKVVEMPVMSISERVDLIIKTIPDGEY